MRPSGKRAHYCSSSYFQMMKHDVPYDTIPAFNIKSNHTKYSSIAIEESIVLVAWFRWPKDSRFLFNIRAAIDGESLNLNNAAIFMIWRRLILASWYISREERRHLVIDFFFLFFISVFPRHMEEFAEYFGLYSSVIIDWSVVRLHPDGCFLSIWRHVTIALHCASFLLSENKKKRKANQVYCRLRGTWKYYRWGSDCVPWGSNIICRDAVPRVYR